MKWPAKADGLLLSWKRTQLPVGVEELARPREMLNSRYDAIKSGKVKLIPGDEVFARRREMSEVRRADPGS